MITLKELAEKVDGKLIGDESIIISSVDNIKLATIDLTDDVLTELKKQSTE